MTDRKTQFINRVLGLTVADMNRSVKMSDIGLGSKKGGQKGYLLYSIGFASNFLIKNSFIKYGTLPLSVIIGIC